MSRLTTRPKISDVYTVVRKLLEEVEGVEVGKVKSRTTPGNSPNSVLASIIVSGINRVRIRNLSGVSSLAGICPNNQSFVAPPPPSFSSAFVQPRFSS